MLLTDLPETKRQLDVLDRHLADHAIWRAMIFHCRYRDMAMVWGIGAGSIYDAAAFLDVQSYRNVQRWTLMLISKPLSADG